MTQGSLLVLVRHGESLWNREQRFTGWADIGLTPDGEAQMRAVAVTLRDAGIVPDAAFSSLLVRCVRSQQILLEAMGLPDVPQHFDWRLNERHYGGLTGRSKKQAELEFGQAEVHRWRRSYEAVPPRPDAAAEAHLAGRAPEAYPADVPVAESLRHTVTRVDQVWRGRIAPALQNGRTVLVVGHGNSLRALVMIIECLSAEAIVRLEVNNAEPSMYRFDESMHWVGKALFSGSGASASQIL